MMVEEFIINHYSYNEAIREFGFIIIWTAISSFYVGKMNRETMFALFPLCFMTLGWILAFEFLGYIMAVLMTIVTIFCFVSLVKRKK